MKQLFAGFVAIWYLVSIMGLDIHRDMEHGRIYVVPALMAQSCEMIHPQAPCNELEGCGCGCCHDSGCEEDEDCCTDDFASVSITGTDTGCQHIGHFQTWMVLTVSTPVPAKAATAQCHSAAMIKAPPLTPQDIPVLNCVCRS